jgi:hypothetical protein
MAGVLVAKLTRRDFLVSSLHFDRQHDLRTGSWPHFALGSFHCATASAMCVTRRELTCTWARASTAESLDHGVRFRTWPTEDIVLGTSVLAFYRA